MNSLKDEFQFLFSGKSPYPKMALWIVLIITTTFTLAFSNRYISEADVAVLDIDNSRYSREFISKLDASPYVKVSTVLNMPAKPASLLYNGKYLAVVYLPAGFERNKFAGNINGNNIGVFFDNTNMSQGAQIREALNSLTAQENFASQTGSQSVSLISRELFNPLGSYTNTMGIGLSLFFAGIFFAQAVIGMVPRLRLENKWQAELAGGNPLATLSRLIPYIIIFVATCTLALVLLRLTNDLILNGSFLLFIPALVILGLALGTAAIFMGWASPNPVAAGKFLLLVCTPGYLFGGMLLPLDFFPGWVQLVTYIFPLKWLYVFVRDILLRGTGWADCMSDYGMFLIYLGGLVLLFSLRFWREQRAAAVVAAADKVPEVKVVRGQIMSSAVE